VNELLVLALGTASKGTAPKVDTPTTVSGDFRNWFRLAVPTLVVAVFCTLFFTTTGQANEPQIKPAKQTPAPADQNKLKPVPPRQDLKVAGRPAFIIASERKLKGPRPWVLYAPTLGRGLPGRSEHWMFRQWLDAGISIAGIDVGESYGSPQGRAIYNALHKHLTTQEAFAQQACLLARSRGGLMLYCWAVENPEKVNGIAGIYPVCNIASYPGLKRACAAYGLTEQQLADQLKKHNPVDRLAPLAKAKVPIYHIHGDVDRTVPLQANSGLLADRYKALGGKIQLNVAKTQGHNMWPGFFQCQPLVDFVLQCCLEDQRKK
jgi:pimeloyl-ACP methyl ester carboxylesterase